MTLQALAGTEAGKAFHALTKTSITVSSETDPAAEQAPSSQGFMYTNDNLHLQVDRLSHS